MLWLIVEKDSRWFDPSAHNGQGLRPNGEIDDDDDDGDGDGDGDGDVDDGGDGDGG